MALLPFLPAVALAVWDELSTSALGFEALVFDKALHFLNYFCLAEIGWLVWRRLAKALELRQRN